MIFLVKKCSELNNFYTIDPRLMLFHEKLRNELDLLVPVNQKLYHLLGTQV